MSAPADHSPVNTPPHAQSLDKRTSEFDAEHALELSEDLGVGDRAAGLVVLEHAGLLVDLLRAVLLGQLLLHARLLDRLADRGRDLRRRRDLVFTVELRYSLVVGAYIHVKDLR